MKNNSLIFFLMEWFIDPLNKPKMFAYVFLLSIIFNTSGYYGSCSMIGEYGAHTQGKKNP